MWSVPLLASVVKNNMQRMHVRLYLTGINAHALLYSLNNNQNEKQTELRFELCVRIGKLVLYVECVALCIYSNKKTLFRECMCGSSEQEVKTTKL
jgi:hypothetical protein